MARRILGVVLAFSAALLSAGNSWANIARASGPTTVFTESRLFDMFDAAFDSDNRVYLVVWGTMGAGGPLNAQLLDVNGAQIGGPFTISSGNQQAGWPRIIYSPEEHTFAVAYTKRISITPALFQRQVRFLSIQNNAAVLGAEVPIGASTANSFPTINSNGIAYSPADHFFIVTWFQTSNCGSLGCSPSSFFATLTTSGTVGPATQLSFPIGVPGNEGFSDPEISCNTSGRCLVVGWSWAVKTWGRFINNGAADPAGAFYVETSLLQKSAQVAYNPVLDRFVVVFENIGSASIVAKTVKSSGDIGAPYLIRRTLNADANTGDGGGYFLPRIAYNPGSSTALVTMIAWSGFTSVQELDSNGVNIAGAFDQLPSIEGSYKNRTQYATAIPDALAARFLVTDDEHFQRLRVTMETAVGVNAPPPPPPPGSGGTPPPVHPDITVFRPDSGNWYSLKGSSGWTTSTVIGWGLPGDIPLRADFDGDGISDMVVYRPSNGTWYILFSSTGFSYAMSAAYQWGAPGDIPMPGDYDGDGKTDIVVYRPSNGFWYGLFSSTQYTTANIAGLQWGLPGDIPVHADFDGDGRSDLVVYRPSEGTWYVLYSSSNYSYATWTSYQWGLPGDIPMAEDIDGDGKADLVVYRPDNGTWYMRFSSINYSLANWAAYQWGLPGDIPIIGDFDGDRKGDLVVFRPSNGTWYFRYSIDGYSYATWRAYGFGLANDTPLMGIIK